MKSAILFMMLLVLLSSGCSEKPDIYTPDPALELAVEPTQIPASSPTPTPELDAPPFDTWIDPIFPSSVINSIVENPIFAQISTQSNAQISIQPTGNQLVGYWTYILAAPFYSDLKTIDLNDIQEFWKTGNLENFSYDQLHLGADTLDFLTLYWGEPDSDIISLTDPAQISEQIWINPDAIAIIPFEELTPSFKVVSVDGFDPFQKQFDPESYPLSFQIHIEIIESDSLMPFEMPLVGNFDPSKLTSVALTGVTALVRDTAVIMEEEGYLYPGDQVREILTSADITHINNEVPFSVDCPAPNSSQESLSFCSDDRYIELIESVGADVIELSGDHFADKGPEAMLHSLDIYEKYGYLTYGGGENLQAGLDPLLIEHNGNQIAFIGCNAKAGQRYATATETNPGASKCDFDWMISEITRLSVDGYLVIATMQHEEIDSFFPVAIQLYDFQRLSDAGAVIVSGSQAHHPQGIEISDSKFIHYGLGNLFFDQWHLARYNPDQHINKDKALIDLHFLYNGSYINTKLIYLQFIDNAQPRPMTDQEESTFLLDFYRASKWNGRWIYLYPAGFFYETDNQ